MLGRLLKFALALAALFLLTQAPFIYRRYQLGRLSAQIAELNARRIVEQADADADYSGVLHVHSFLGGHSTGSFAEIISAAQSNQLDFVVMTEHPSAFFDTRRTTLQGQHGGVLFIAGSETSESERDRFLSFGGDTPPIGGEASAATASPQTHINREQAAGNLVFVAHPETYAGWDTAQSFHGMEIYNLHADAKHINRVTFFFDGLWSYRSYAPLLWTRFHQNPAENLRRWDELTARRGRKIVAVAGNDAHANVGLNLQDLTGRPLLQLKLDPYERSFQVVRTHILLARDQLLNRESVLEALTRGHTYVSFDILADATGFRFSATNGAEVKQMGDEINLAGGVKLSAKTPLACRLRLVKDGHTLFEEKETARREWLISERGVYRVEAYLSQLPAPLNDKPWIISNPIYVR